MNAAGTLALVRLSVAGSWAQNRGRLILTTLGIVLGVALGTAVLVINHSAVAELDSAVRALSGDADITIQGSRAGFDEVLYPRLARHKSVAASSPTLEIEAKLVDHAASLRVIGLDPFRALSLQPALLGDASEHIVELLRPDTALVSAAAARQFGLRAGDTLRMQIGLDVRAIRILGVLPVNDATRQALVVMDVASAQWLFDRTGSLSRIDLRLREGVDTASFLHAVQRDLPAGVNAVRTSIASQQSLALSRAYRVNLGMLALVALFTGAVLVTSVQTLALVRRRSQFALMRALGLPAGTLTVMLIGEALLLGFIGTVIGIALGVGVASLGLTYLGPDLGAGFFANTAARLWIDPPTLTLVALGAIGACALAGAIPALELARASVAQALRAGDEQRVLRRLPGVQPALWCALLALVLALAPAIDGLPYLGYAAIATLLIAALLAVPAYARTALACLPLPRAAALHLGVQQLRGATGYAGVSLAAILAAFSFTVAMLVMIHSFRSSLEHWLQVVLPADIYARAGPGASAWIDTGMQERMRDVPGVARVAFVRHVSLTLDAAQPPVTLIARDLDPRAPEGLPLLAPQRLPETPDAVPVWISEAVHDLYGYAPGQRITLPLTGHRIAVTIAGVWRDYTRLGGALLMARADYIRLSADRRANEAWIWVTPGTPPAEAIAGLRRTLALGVGLELRDPATVRRLSLATFDRTFAVTYALQVVALLIGLFGISASVSAQAVARRREFGVLRHLGMTRRQVGAALAFEGSIVGALGAVAGIVTGMAMSMVLIHVVNRQSFHWSMDLAVPWAALALLAALLIAAAALTAAVSGRRATDDDVVRAVREDW